MENAQVARVLSEIADVMELVGGNPFKVRAYRQAAQVIDVLPGPVSELWRRGVLDELPGIGAHIAAHIGELLEHGTCVEHQRLVAQVPPGLLDLLAIEGVGPKTVAAVWHTIGVTSVEALERACRDGTIRKVARMGDARTAAMLEAIARYRARQGRTPLHRALPYAESILKRLRRVPGVARAEAAGSLRRRRETIGDLDLLVGARDPAPVIRAFSGMRDVAAVIAEGPTKCSVRLDVGLQVDLRVVPEDAFGAALHYFTGSKSHNIAIRSRAVRMGIKLSEYGVFDRHGKRLAGADEQDVFRAVGLPFIPPELREGAGELEAAEAGTLPVLVEEDDVVGDLHVHTKASSDAKQTLAEVAEAARRLGRAYVAITDHSRSRPLGLDEARLRAQRAEVRALDAKLRGRPHLLAGVEVDILPDGSLDLDLEALAELDVVVASVHSHFDQPRREMTARLVRAIESGVVHVIGHPSGRVIGSRDACDLDLDAILAAARRYGVALEINAMPERLDLTDKAARCAKEAGVPVVISSDAHLASHLENLRYGVWVARRAWLEKGDVLDTRSCAELKRWLARAEPSPPKRRSRRPHA